jgi:hypothetical protein
MFIIIAVLLLFVVLDIAALIWGFDTTESITSCEWNRRWHQLQ